MINQRRYLIVFIIFLALGLGIGGYYFIKLNSKSDQNQTPLPITYREFRGPEGFIAQYPNWSTLDIVILNRFIQTIMPKELTNRNKILVAVADGLGGQVVISRRQLIKEEMNQPFGNLIKDVQTKESQALLNAGAIQEFRVLEESYQEKEVLIKSESIDGRGVGYINISKSFLVETQLLGINNKYIYTLTFSAPTNTIAKYSQIINDIYQSVKKEK